MEDVITRYNEILEKITDTHNETRRIADVQYECMFDQVKYAALSVLNETDKLDILEYAIKKISSSQNNL